MMMMRKMRKKVLITGVSGLLGNNLAQYFREKCDVQGFYALHKIVMGEVGIRQVDLLSEAALKMAVREFSPDMLIHCASLTNVDYCESHREITDRVNVLGTRHVIESVKGMTTKVVYISSDSVYEGSVGSFKEEGPIKPQNYYGLSKLDGEKEVLRRDGSLVLRTNIFGWNIQDKFSLAEWIMRELSHNRPIKGFWDVYFSSIYTFELAKVLEQAISRDLSGVYNCGSRTSMSKFEFARLIAETFSLDTSLVQPVSIDASHLSAKRGKNLTLDVEKMEKALGCRLPTLEESVRAFRRDYDLGVPTAIKKNSGRVTQSQ